MTSTLPINEVELTCSQTLFRISEDARRHLGCAILLAAIEDYKSLDDQEHASAARFLYPSSPDYREHYNWAVAMAGNVNPGWLRSSLDRTRREWDRERFERKLKLRLEATLRTNSTRTQSFAANF